MIRSPRSPARSILGALATAALLPLLAACGGGGGGEEPRPPATRLVQYGYVTGTGIYEYGYDSIAQLDIRDAPADADTHRWAMAHGGSTYLLLMFQVGSDTTLYPFAYDGGSYRWIGITVDLRGTPADANTDHMAVLHDGGGYRLYLRSRANPEMLYQHYTATLATGFVYGAGPTSAVVETTGIPADADPNRWTMFHDGTTYRQAMFRRGSNDILYQFGWNGSTYAYGHASRDLLKIEGRPEGVFTDQAKILHDGERYRMYQGAP